MALLQGLGAIIIIILIVAVLALWVIGALPALLGGLTSILGFFFDVPILVATLAIIGLIVWAARSGESSNSSGVGGAGLAGLGAGILAGLANSNNRESNGSTEASPQNSTEPTPSTQTPSAPDNTRTSKEEQTTSGTSRRPLENSIQNLIKKLEASEEIEIASIEEKNEAEERLKIAFNALLDEKPVLKAMLYFRNVDLNRPAGEVHSDVQGIIKKINGIGSVEQLLREVEKVDKILKEIELAHKEVRDSFEKDSNIGGIEREKDYTMNEIDSVISAVREGASNYQRCIEQGYHNAPTG